MFYMLYIMVQENGVSTNALEKSGQLQLALEKGQTIKKEDSDP